MGVGEGEVRPQDQVEEGAEVGVRPRDQEGEGQEEEGHPRQLHHHLQERLRPLAPR